MSPSDTHMSTSDTGMSTIDTCMMLAVSSVTLEDMTLTTSHMAVRKRPYLSPKPIFYINMSSNAEIGFFVYFECIPTLFNKERKRRPACT